MPPLEGRIGPLTIPSLIHDACSRNLTGTLALEDLSIRKTLYLEDGHVVFGASTDPDDRLGGLFLRHGMVSLATLQAAMEQAAGSGERLGAALVKQKAIRPQDLVWGVTEQVRSLVTGLFGWVRGEYRLTEQTLPSKEVITLKISTPDLIMAGIRSVQAWSRIEAAVGDTRTRYNATPRLTALASEMDLSLEEWTLLSRCESGFVLGQLCEDSSLPDFEICRLVWAFSVVGLLEREETATASAAL